MEYSYNINQLTQDQALSQLDHRFEIEKWISTLKEERAQMMRAFAELRYCRCVYPSDANFFLARMQGADRIYRYLVERGIIVRNRSKVELCDDCLRVTIGTKNENNTLLAALRQYQP